ncbi:hypothetical protein FHT77_003470 [Rhizobium sp. BK181]|uniref:hypothetical protein n=1 Tax=Rhizobium sp. BK181 TaxID=2587072 RepID=UPI0016123A8E|nr:hypothetical protein [Rhizobium sp. BK181]MBB3317581.1 hypothetical protein [Rhizobium sp. BK181]
MMFKRIWIAKSPNCSTPLHLQRFHYVLREFFVGYKLLADFLDPLQWVCDRNQRDGSAHHAAEA